MAEKKPLDRYVEAGKEFTEASRQRASRRSHTISPGRARPGASTPKIGRRRWSSGAAGAAEQLGDLVKREIREQIKQFNLATNQDVIKVVQQFVERTTKAAAAPVRDVASRTMTATKKAARASPKRQEGAPRRRPAAKKADADKKAAAKKAPAAKKAGHEEGHRDQGRGEEDRREEAAPRRRPAVAEEGSAGRKPSPAELSQ